MQLYLLFLVMVIFVCAFGYMAYHHEAEKRALEKTRNHAHDRVESVGQVSD